MLRQIHICRMIVQSKNGQWIRKMSKKFKKIRKMVNQQQHQQQLQVLVLLQYLSLLCEQWPDFGCEGIKVQRAHQPTSQCQGKKSYVRNFILQLVIQSINNNNNNNKWILMTSQRTPESPKRMQIRQILVLQRILNKSVLFLCQISQRILKVLFLQGMRSFIIEKKYSLSQKKTSFGSFLFLRVLEENNFLQG
eukprot:TRINITY_DN17172_c0_g2_i9.p2 TRINITY_DN17172_c0_g2~~TRINITY_DN17172_c0_g2_i9.p2  ORF type:complete len:193 (-),score=3.00 TRINITY_DN17172_c0_g2_i9:17-595(-)